MPNHVLVALMMGSNVGTPNKNGVNPRLLMEKFKKDALVITIYHACSCFCANSITFFLTLLGVTKYQDTLSLIGGPCHFNYTDVPLDSEYSCAICVADAHQCGPYVDLPVATFTHGQYCARGAANSICYGKSKKNTIAFSR